MKYKLKFNSYNIIKFMMNNELVYFHKDAEIPFFIKLTFFVLKLNLIPVVIFMYDLI
jgi:hypothetical protein